MPVSQTRFRHVLGHLASGVSLVTTLGPEGNPRGLTATAVCSISLRPPLVLASIDRDSNTHLGIEASGFYAVNFLGADQEELAVRFATDAEDKFRGLTLGEAVTGAPVLGEALGHLDCTLERSVEAGDHTLFVGRVEEARVGDGDLARPLVYHLGRYTTLRGEEV